MPVTEKQKKLIWVGAALLGAYYFAPSLINAARHSFSHPQAEVAKPSPIRIAPVNQPAPLTPIQASNAQVARQLTGDWIGAGVLPARGLCRIGLQIKPDPLKPGSFTGYSTTGCNPALALTGQAANRQNRAQAAIASMTPVSVIMTGSISGAEMDFTVDKNIGAPPDGCVITGFTASPFGEMLAAEWKAGTCPAGQMILKKATNIQ